MARDFKPVNDRTISDVNQMNRDAWDSGEFRHEDAKNPRTGAEAYQQGHPKEAAETAARNAEVLEKAASSHKTPYQKRVSPGTLRPSGRPKDAADVRHTPEGGQRLVRGGQVVSHHDEVKFGISKPSLEAQAINTPSREARKQEAKKLIPADDPKHFAHTGPRPGSVGGHPDTGDEVKKAVHLPRRAGRQWRKGEWS